MYQPLLCSYTAETRKPKPVRFIKNLRPVIYKLIPNFGIIKKAFQKTLVLQTGS